MDGLNRAYAIITEKSIDGDRRTFRGMATTPTPDRVGDVIDPMGAKFRNPLPLLHQHDKNRPIGQARFLKATPDGIEFEAEIPTIHEPGLLKERVDLAWGEIKAGLIRAVSIGFRPLKDGYEVMKTGGLLFKAFEVLELSAVTIPANSDCSIMAVKSIDTALLAASGQEQVVDTPTPPGVSGLKKHPVTAKEAKRVAKTYAEQIKDFEASILAKTKRREEIQAKVSEENRTKDAAEREEFETLADEIKTYEAELVDLRGMETKNVQAAVPVEAVTDSKTSSIVRAGGSVPAMVRSNTLPKGTAFARYAMALGASKGNLMQAAEISKRWENTPEVYEVLKAAVAAGTTSDATWAAPLVNYQVMTGDFIEYLRPMTILGRVPGFRMVPFNIRVPSQTSGSTAYWVGEGQAKPLSALAFATVTLTWSKIAAIVVMTDELVRFSNPSAEGIVRGDLAATIAAYMDRQFVDPTKAADGSSPASVTNGVTPVTASGVTPDALRADIKTLITSVAANNLSLSGGVWLMTQQQAIAISLMRTSLGQPEFPGVTFEGGTLAGFPIIASESIPGTGGSPTDGSLIIFLLPNQILVADDGSVTLDASREASLQMDSAPDSPVSASTVPVSLFQQNMIAIRAERYVNWQKARSTAVSFIQNAKYADA